MTPSNRLGSNRVILLVEDDADHATLTVRALTRHNVANEVVIARDGAEALDYLFCQGAFADRDIRMMPQLITLDLKLPKIDGLEVLRRLRENERTKLLPVVILTSSDEEKDLVASYSLGVNSYVRKPVDFNDLMEATRQLGMYWLVLNTSPPIV